MASASSTATDGATNESLCRLPTQNELFAYFMLLCGHHRIKKPPKAIAALLEEDETSRSERLTREAVALQITSSQIVEAQQDTQQSVQRRSHVVPLSSRTTVPMLQVAKSVNLLPPNDTKIHLGNRGVVVWLMLVAQCPLLEELDLTVVTSLYAADAYRTSIGGNHVVDVLCEVAERHPSLRKVDIRGHPLGTASGIRLLSAAQSNRRLTAIEFDEAGIDRLVVRQIKSQVERNAAVAASLPPPTLPTTLSPELESLQWIDRKTSRERQSLRNIMLDVHAFRECTDEELDRIVDHAERTSLEQVVKDSAGLRGDRQHLFIIESGSLDVMISNTPFPLARGDYFGYAYHNAMFSAGIITERERGNAFRVPLEVCDALVQRWERAVDQILPMLKESITLQSAHVWMLMRACHTATIVSCDPHHEHVVAFTPRGKPFAGLFVVVEGLCEAAPQLQPGEGKGSTRHECRSDLQARNVGSQMTTRSLPLLDQYKASEERANAERQLAAAKEILNADGRRTAASGGFAFSPGDVFGEEPLTLKRVTGYVTEIRAVVPTRCVLLPPEAATPIILTMKQTLRVATKTYTQALE